MNRRYFHRAWQLSQNADYFTEPERAAKEAWGASIRKALPLYLHCVELMCNLLNREETSLRFRVRKIRALTVYL